MGYVDVYTYGGILEYDICKERNNEQFVSWSMAEEICPKGCKVQAICLAFEISVNPWCKPLQDG